MHCFAPVLKVPRCGEDFFVQCLAQFSCTLSLQTEASGDMDLNEFSAPNAQVERVCWRFFLGGNG